MLFHDFQYYYLFIIFLLTSAIEIEDRNKVKFQMLLRHQREKQCYDIPDEWLNRVVATDTWGLCIDMYSGKNCTGGKHIRLYPGNPHHSDLHLWNFKNSLASVKLCDEDVNEENYEDKGNTVTLFEKSGYKGNFRHLNIFGCTNLPSTWKIPAFSIETYEQCYNFHDGVNCTGDYISGQNVSMGDGFWFVDLRSKIKSISQCNSQFNSKQLLDVTTDETENKITDTITYNISDTTTAKIELIEDKTADSTTNTFVLLYAGTIFAFLLVFIIIVSIGIFAFLRMRKKYRMKQFNQEMENQRYLEYLKEGNTNS